ncbi:MAG: cytochrome P450 [Actinobacteria bacterium]|nr:cytochrome P450 [Actinomycetota bacterium]
MSVGHENDHLLSSLAFEGSVPHEFFKTLRDEDPAHWTEPGDGSRGFWSFTRYEDVVALSRDTGTFSSEKGGTTLEDIPEADLQGRRTMIDTDPPLHTGYRKILAPSFNPGIVRRNWDERVETIVSETFTAALAEEGEIEYVSKISSEIPVRVLAALLDVPDSEAHYIMELGDEMIASSDPDHAPRTALTPEVLAENSKYQFSSPAGRELWEYGDKLRIGREKDLGHDVFSLLITSEVDGRKLTPHELANFFSLLVIAGNETTRMAFSHAAKAFCDFPDQWTKLRENPQLVDSAVEEILRWATPIHHFRRTVTQDTEMHGKKLEAGDKVAIWYASANYDERVFTNPHTFDIERKPNFHLAFGGGGAHRCLGNSLARLELKVLLQHQIEQVESFELAGEVKRLRSNLTHGLKRLPIRMNKIAA